MNIQTLKEQNLILFEVISGSHAYGLATPTSDTDIKGVFYLPKDQFFGLEYIAQVNDEKNDTVYYELGRFLELLSKGNPNILEILATPAPYIIYKNPLLEDIQLADYISIQTVVAFKKYALTQLLKAKGLNKKINNPEPVIRKDLLDFCYIIEDNKSIDLKSWLIDHNIKQEKCGLSKLPHTKGFYGLFYEDTTEYNGIIKSEIANEVCLSSIALDAPLKAYLFFNEEAWSAHCKSFRSYWNWVKIRNEERFVNNPKQNEGFDAKNMMHMIRLLQSALYIAQHHTLNISASNRADLLAIKQGTVSYETLLQQANSLQDQIDASLLTSKLPATVDKHIAEKTLIKLRKILYHESRTN